MDKWKIPNCLSLHDGEQELARRVLWSTPTKVTWRHILIQPVRFYSIVRKKKGKKRMKHCKSKWEGRDTEWKGEGKICFLKVPLLRHKPLCLFTHKTLRYLNQIQQAAVHQRTTGYVQDSFFSTRRTKVEDQRLFLKAVYKTLSCKISSPVFSRRNSHLSFRNKCFFFESSVVSTALNRKAGSD